MHTLSMHHALLVLEKDTFRSQDTAMVTNPATEV